MMKRTLACAAVCAGLTAVGIAAEPLVEVLLPLHDNRDAYTPAAACFPRPSDSGGDVFLVAWQSGRNGPGDLRKGIRLVGDIVGCRVDRSGKALDASPFVICGAPDQQEDPRAACGSGAGDVFLVVWQDIRNGKDWDIYAARVSVKTGVLDKDGFLVSGGAHNQAKPRVAWDGKTFVIVWQDLRAGDFYAMYAARVTTEGKVLDPEGIKVASGGFYHCFTPAIASAGNGRSFVVHIAAGLPVNNYKSPMVQGWFITDGKPDAQSAYTLDKKGKDDDQGPDARGDPMTMAAGGGAYLLAWKNDSSLGRGFGPDGNAALFDDKGARKANPHFAAGKGPKDPKRILNPSIAWDGTGFAVAWHEFIREQKVGCPSDVVFVQWVDSEGKPQGAPQCLSGTFASPASAPAAASNGSGTTLIAYEKHPDKADTPIKIGYRMITMK